MHRKRRLILTYLIPCQFVTNHKLPTSILLAQYPRLERLFSPLVKSIKNADLAGFDAALLAGEPEFVKRRIYLTLERGRDIVLRNLLRKVYLAGGFEPLKEGQTEADAVRRTRIPVPEFAAAMRLSLGQNNGEVLEDDEVECMLANMIYKVCVLFVSTSISPSSSLCGKFQPPEVGRTSCLGHPCRKHQNAFCDLQFFASASSTTRSLTRSLLQGLMKGYISRERSIVVLSKGKVSPFPGTGL
jgi:hypothetical protein